MPEHLLSLTQFYPQSTINKITTITLFQKNQLLFQYIYKQTQTSQYEQNPQQLQLNTQSKINNPIKIISLSHFIHLNQLYLDGNQIQNIQSLAFIDAPQLDLLNLSQNHITNFNPLIKANLSSIQYLNTSNNPNVQHQFLKKCQFSTKMISLVLNDYQQNLFNSMEEEKNITHLKTLSADSVSTILLTKVNMKSILNFSKFFVILIKVLLSDKFQVRMHIVEKLPQYRQCRQFYGSDKIFQVM